MLIFVVSMGAEAAKVQKLIKFKLYYIITDYIDLNTAMKINAKTESEMATFKLINIALFGKNCENPLEHREAKILTDEHIIPKICIQNQ